MEKRLEKNPVPYHFAKYGEDLLMEGVGLDEETVEMIKVGLPADVRAKVFGWRNVSVLPYGKGEGNQLMVAVGVAA